MKVFFHGRSRHGREIAALVASLVYRYAERRQPGQVHEQVVHEIAQPAVVVPPDYRAEGYAVHSAERMVAYESVKAAVVLGRKVLAPYDVERHVEIAHGGLKPLHARQPAALPKILVDLVLVEYALKPFHYGLRHVARLVAHLALEYLLNVDGLLRDVVHVSYTNPAP